MGSVRGERVVYRESDREYEEAPRRTYTTIKRYQVPEAVTRAVYQEDDEVKDKLIIKRERRDDRAASRDSRREDVEYRFSERVSERERDPPRRDIHYRVVERDSDFDRSRSEYRVVDRERSSVRAPSPPAEERERVYRIEREREFSPPREREYDVERYSKSTEYFTQPPSAPQPIIIRESAPTPIIIREGRRDPTIIIREERREPHYEFIEKKEVEETKEETKSLVKREETPPPPPAPAPEPQQKPEEDYFYERRVVERRRRSESIDRKSEVRPRDSASQYSSDDSYEYVRRERIVDDDGRSHSPHHKRHLAEGAIAGIGAAEIIRRHRKKQGEDTRHRGRDLIGGAAVGALGAEALSRVRSMRSLRRSSRSRSSSQDRDTRKHGRRRHSRSKSLSRAQQLGGLAAVAAVGALAGYALNKNRNGKETVIINDRPHRSRSRRRRRSQYGDAYNGGDNNSNNNNNARDPDHRNRRIAQAGLASAAAAGIWETVRSRSRGGKSRERSRLRTGVPIAAAGLGGAALAGLYEKNKANKEAKRDAIIEDELHRGRRRRSRSRSRSRSVAAPYPTSTRGGGSDRGMIAYGNEPIYPTDGHGGYYSDEEPGVYHRRRGSSGSSPDTRHRRGSRSRSRARDMGGPPGSSNGRDRSRGNRDQGHYDNEYPYNDQYNNQGDPYSPPPMGHNAGHNGGYGAPAHQAPSNAPYFPPPPTGEAQAGQAYGEQQQYPTYNPADYASQPPGHPPQGANNGGYGDGGHAYGGPDHQQQPGAEGRRGNDPENVSVFESTGHDQHEEPHEADGVKARTRAHSGSHVRFDLDPSLARSTEALQPRDGSRNIDIPHGRRHQRDGDGANDDSSIDDNSRASHRHKNQFRSRNDPRRDSHSHHDSPDLMHDPSDRHFHHRQNSEDDDSDGTVELPARFDEHGNRADAADNPLATHLGALFSGNGAASGLLNNIANGLLGGRSQHGDADSGSERGSRRRRRR